MLELVLCRSRLVMKIVPKFFILAEFILLITSCSDVGGVRVGSVPRGNLKVSPSEELKRLYEAHQWFELNEKLGKYAEKKLAERGVEIHLNTLVSDVAGGEVILSDGTRVVTNTIIWTAGTAPNPLLDTLPCDKDRGKICANEFMEVPGYDGVWAVGDCASIKDKDGKPFPPTAQHAIRQGKVLAHNIEAAVRGGRKKPFVFETIGQLAALGRRTGVAQILGINFSGFIAWWLWRTIYLMKLPRFEKKLRVALDWTLDLFFTKDPVQFLTLRAPTVSEKE